MNYDTIEYSVCVDCLMYITYGDECDDSAGFIAGKVANELNGKEGHFSCGVEPTEDDPAGTGDEEFSWQECELCRSTLGGSRHGVTLFIKKDEEV
jgi:hypothetical protein